MKCQATLLLCTVLPIAVTAASAQQPNGDRNLQYHPKPFTISVAPVSNAGSIPLWAGKSGGTQYYMVGASPFAASGNVTTTVNSPIVPLILTFSDGTVLDTTVPDKGCGQTASAASLTAASPLFNNYNFVPGGTVVGNTQYIDFFQRANFWQYTKPDGVAPAYHLLLNATVLAPVQITVPASSGYTRASSCGKVGRVDLDWFANYLEGTVFPSLDPLQVGPTTIPIFLTYSTGLYEGTPDICCVGGYHTIRNARGPVQTYAFANYDYVSDVSALSHELGEWADDPYVNNRTPLWGNIGQVQGCQGDLEVGDPLTGTEITAMMPNGRTYHLQELAFASWFYGQTPSSGIYGWYSSNGTFRTGAAACLDSPAVTLSPASLTFAAQAVGTSSAPQTFKLSNTGNEPLTGIGFSIGGSDAGDFSQTTNCGNGGLIEGRSCTITVIFSPTSSGARNAVVAITDNAADSPQAVTLTGAGSGAGFSSQRVTGTVPPAAGACVTPASVSVYSATDHSVYLWFLGTVSTSDVISNDWLAPDGSVVPGKVWSSAQGSFCYSSSSLDVSALPTSRLGQWAARVYSSGRMAFSVPFTVNPVNAPAYKSQYILSQVADGGGWTTTLNLINPSTTAVSYRMNLTNDLGGALPITAGVQTASTFAGSVPAGASVTYISSGPSASQDGLATVATTTPLIASGVFSFSSAGKPTFEAAVPALSAPAQTLLFPFDNQNGKATGLALANTGTSDVKVTLVFRPETGAAVNLGILPLTAGSKTAFVLTDKYLQLTGQRGTLTMDAGVPVLTGLGIRGLATGAFTSLPVYAVGGPVVTRQILSHVIDGGIWQSTITLVNSDAQPASYQIRLFDGAGNPVQTKLNGTLGSTFTGTLASLTSATFVTQGASSPTQLDGWADVTSSQRVQAQLVFDQFTPGQPVFEAAVPAIAAGQSSVAMPYDNSNGLTTGIAVANAGTAAASVQVGVRDETGAVTDKKVILLAAGAKTTFVLPSLAPNSAGKRGLVQITSPGGSVAALALRFNGLDFTTLPVAAADPAAAP